MYAVMKLLTFERDIETIDGKNLKVINKGTKYFIPVFENFEDADEASCNGKFEIIEMITG